MHDNDLPYLPMSSQSLTMLCHYLTASDSHTHRYMLHAIFSIDYFFFFSTNFAELNTNLPKCDGLKWYWPPLETVVKLIDLCTCTIIKVNFNFKWKIADWLAGMAGWLASWLDWTCHAFEFIEYFIVYADVVDEIYF